MSHLEHSISIFEGQGKEIFVSNEDMKTTARSKPGSLSNEVQIR